MSIPQTLKLLNKPLDELAMLPQETIMQMAQREQIPPSYVAPILGRKAELAQAGANAAALAQAQQAPGSVMDQLVAQNAAAEAQDMGVGSLPVREDMYASAGDQRYAGGGIIAFAEGEEVSKEQMAAADEASDRSMTPGGRYELERNRADSPTSLEEVIRYVEEKTGKPVARPSQPVQTAPVVAERVAPARSLTDDLKDLQDMYKAVGYDYGKIREAEERRLDKQESELTAEKTHDAWMATLRAGLGMVAGESPYALTNIGKGAELGLESYARSNKESRAAQKEINKARSELAKADQLDRKGMAAEAIQLRMKGLDRAIEQQKADATTLAAKAQMMSAANPKDTTLQAAAISAQVKLAELEASRLEQQLKAIDAGLDPTYSDLKNKNPKEAEKYRTKIEAALAGVIAQARSVTPVYSGDSTRVSLPPKPSSTINLSPSDQALLDRYK